MSIYTNLINVKLSGPIKDLDYASRRPSSILQKRKNKNLPITFKEFLSKYNGYLSELPMIIKNINFSKDYTDYTKQSANGFTRKEFFLIHTKQSPNGFTRKDFFPIQKIILFLAKGYKTFQKYPKFPTDFSNRVTCIIQQLCEKIYQDTIQTLKNSLCSLNQRIPLTTNKDSLNDLKSILIEHTCLLDHFMEHQKNQDLNEAFKELRSLMRIHATMEASLFPVESSAEEKCISFLESFLSNKETVEDQQKRIRIE